MGRAPCCDKANVKKGPWSPEEDAKLKSYIEKNGTGGNWIALPQKIGLKRCGKSCRLRWLNYLRPNLKHGGFSEEEDNIICSLYISIGSRWSIIAAQLPGRTDNDIKNYWNTRLKKKLLGKQRKENHSRRGSNSLKQETTKRSNPNNVNNLNSSDQIQNHYRYWPELPLLNPAPLIPPQDHAFNDHNSIRKLLIKLGGKFSDDPVYNPQLIHNDNAVNYGPNPMYDSMNVPSSSGITVELGQTPCNWSNGMQVLQGQSNFCGEITEIGYNSDERFDGLEFLLSDNSYGSQFSEMSSMIGYANCGEEMQRKLMNEDCGFDDRMRYNGC